MRAHNLVGMGKPRRIHLVSQCLIRQFAKDDRVTVRQHGELEQGQQRRVASVGWRPGWWGSDGNLTRDVEELLRHTEDRAAPVLREIDAKWPLDRDARAELAQFVAIHVVRGSAWRDAYEMASLNAMSEELKRQRFGDQVERMAFAEFVSDPLRTSAMLRDIPRVASILMSMCWSLVRFDEALLGCGDQPVVWYPLLPPRQRAAISAMPRRGFMDTIEVRFPVGPSQLLLLTWAPRPDFASPVPGGFRHAADVNRSTRTQTDRDWFFRVGTRPPLLAGANLSWDCEPLSYELLAGYSFDVARTSSRRAQADELIKELVTTGATNEMRFVVVSDPSASPE